MLIESKGQSAEFTIKSPVAIAKNQNLIWDEVTSAKSNFQIAGNTAADSVICTCGSYSWTTEAVKTNTRILIKLDGTVPTGHVGDVLCAAGTISCVVRDWSSTNTAAKD